MSKHANFHLFICEVCTVRAICDRELHGRHDWNLLCLERMRILDIANSWAPGTLQAYSSSIIAVHRVEKQFGVHVLPRKQLKKPPTSSIISLMWMQEHRNLKKDPSDLEGQETRAFGTIRQARSAVAQQHYWREVIANPESGYLDQQRRLIQVPVRPTEAAGLTAFDTGMAERIGTATQPSMALLARHVLTLDQELEQKFQSATLPESKRRFALAGLANLHLYHGWLRSRETFECRWHQVSLMIPAQGPKHDLPVGFGVCSIRMGPETKSSRSSCPNVVVC